MVPHAHANLTLGHRYPQARVAPDRSECSTVASECGHAWQDSYEGRNQRHDCRSKSHALAIDQRHTTPDDDVDRADAAARESTLVSRLIAEDLGPTGRPWTSARARDVQSTQYLLCWPTSRPVPPPWARAGEIVGMLPERTELVTRRHVEHDTTSGSLHSQMVALFGALASRDADVRGLEVRQQVMGLRESSHTLEVATDLR